MPLYIYTNDIPFEDNSPSDDQPDMKVNTNSISSILNVDMIGFNDVNGGYHDQLTFIQQGSNPGSAATQYRQYSKSVGGASELFVQKDGTATPIQLTRGVPVLTDGGYTYLPGGLLMQWKNVAIPATSGTFTFPVAFTSILLTVMLAPQGNTNMYVSASSLTSVTVTRNGSGATGCWVTVIGV